MAQVIPSQRMNLWLPKSAVKIPMQLESTEFERIEGKSFPFYGVCDNQFKLGNIIWEAVEDPSDGYRSCLGVIRVAGPIGMDILQKNAQIIREHCTITGPTDSIFFKSPIAQVKVVRVDNGDEFDGHHLIDTQAKHKHIWLSIGTRHRDDYYPSFVFHYQPKAPGSLHQIKKEKIQTSTATWGDTDDV